MINISVLSLFKDDFGSIGTQIEKAFVEHVQNIFFRNVLDSHSTGKG
jgi:hypothetical protein